MQLKKQCVDFLKATIDKSAAPQLQYLHNQSPHFVHMGVNDITLFGYLCAGRVALDVTGSLTPFLSI
jgi:hypothetical protein